jgi:hypothetical protein
MSWGSAFSRVSAAVHGTARLRRLCIRIVAVPLARLPARPAQRCVARSANLNVRSWTHDSELSIGVLDDLRDPRPPADPGDFGAGARRFAPGLRLELMREHLDLRDDAELLDPDRAVAWIRDSAAALEAWYAVGCRGLRPAGRLRPHAVGRSAGLPAAWHRWLTGAAYRAFLDPDGRPLGMRLRRTY